MRRKNQLQMSYRRCLIESMKIFKNCIVNKKTNAYGVKNKSFKRFNFINCNCEVNHKKKKIEGSFKKKGDIILRNHKRRSYVRFHNKIGCVRFKRITNKWKKKTIDVMSILFYALARIKALQGFHNASFYRDLSSRWLLSPFHASKCEKMIIRRGLDKLRARHTSVGRTRYYLFGSPKHKVSVNCDIAKEVQTKLTILEQISEKEEFIIKSLSTPTLQTTLPFCSYRITVYQNLA